jgi:hypothetical protein
MVVDTSAWPRRGVARPEGQRLFWRTWGRRCLRWEMHRSLNRKTVFSRRFSQSIADFCVYPLIVFIWACGWVMHREF